MTDDFSTHSETLTAPAAAAETITPSDTQDLAFVTRALYVGQGGDVAVELKSGDSVVLRNMQASVIYPLRVMRVLATGTTAADIVGLR
ncbi:MAG: hypothetical protein AAF231_00025 [Pseudomonadota bacterium]